jgi:uncharacterized protein (TIGR00297 family)
LNVLNAGIIIGILIVLFLLSRILNLFDFKGSVAALILGFIVAFLGSLQWLILLIIFAVVSHFATKAFFQLKKSRKLQEGVAGERKISNVVYAGIIAIFISSANFTSIITRFPSFHYFTLFAASISVIASDTFASELGVIDRRVYMITTLKRTTPGINGGVSPYGEISAMLGALIVAVSFGILRGGPLDWFYSLIVFSAGFFGCQIDSVLGALFENRGYIGKGTVNMLASLAGVLLSILIFTL